MKDVGIVVIGRNEGERLRRCLASVLRTGVPVVYVDSASADGSVELAREMGAATVELDPAEPLSAARGRNRGARHLLERHPDVAHLQFVDGDCELALGWLDAAMETLHRHPEAAVVFGRLRERHPEASVYHRLCDMEFNGTPGEAPFCGGLFMTRAEAFREVGGMDETLTAGEEPEMCVRLRQGGWTIRRIEAEMGTHDAAMDRFGQWWRRCVRSGRAFAEGAARHGRSPQRHWRRESRSVWFWGLGWPLVLLAATWPTAGWSLLGFAGYPAMAVRIARSRRRGFGDHWPHALLYGGWVMLGKVPEAIGQLGFWWDRLRGRRGRTGTPKPPATPATSATGESAP